MEHIIDMKHSRQAREERQEQFKNAAEDLMNLLEQYRKTIPEEFMTFLLAMAASEQAVYYASEADTAQAGYFFMDHLIQTAEQLYEVHLRQPQGERINPLTLKTLHRNGQVLDFNRQQASQPIE